MRNRTLTIRDLKVTFRPRNVCNNLKPRWAGSRLARGFRAGASHRERGAAQVRRAGRSSASCGSRRLAWEGGHGSHRAGVVRVSRLSGSLEPVWTNPESATLGYGSRFVNAGAGAPKRRMAHPGLRAVHSGRVPPCRAGKKKRGRSLSIGSHPVPVPPDGMLPLGTVSPSSRQRAGASAYWRGAACRCGWHGELLASRACPPPVAFATSNGAGAQRVDARAGPFSGTGG